MVDIMAASAGRTKTRKKVKATKRATNKAPRKAAPRKGASAKEKAPAKKETSATVVSIEGEVHGWITDFAVNKNRSKRDVILAALEYARTNDFDMDAYLPPAVAKWLAKTGRSIA